MQSYVSQVPTSRISAITPLRNHLAHQPSLGLRQPWCVHLVTRGYAIAIHAQFGVLDERLLDVSNGTYECVA